MSRATTWPRACRVCGTTNQSELSRASDKPGGVDTICRPCKRAQWKLHVRTTDERQRRNQTGINWAKKNPDRAREAKAAHNRRLRQNPPAHRKAIGEAVRAWRLAHGATQAELSALMGIKPSALSGRENGIRPWPPGDLDKLKRAGVAIPEWAEAKVRSEKGRRKQ